MNKLNLTCKPILNGIMAYWSSEENAARYIVTLYIGDMDVSTRINERTEKYCTFTNLAELDTYKVKVVSEGRNGEVTAESDLIQCSVLGLIDSFDNLRRAIRKVAQTTRF